MNESNKHNDAMQELCRKYLSMLRGIASKYGLIKPLNDLINMNRRNECSGTEQEVEMLARMVDDERISRNDIPKLFGMSYRMCYERGYFDHIKKLKNNGTYSKVSALLHKSEI